MVCMRVQALGKAVSTPRDMPSPEPRGHWCHHGYHSRPALPSKRVCQQITATALCIAKLCQLRLVGNHKIHVEHMTSEEQIAKINKRLSLSPVMLLTGPASRLQENSSLSWRLQRFRHVLNSPTQAQTNPGPDS